MTNIETLMSMLDIPSEVISEKLLILQDCVVGPAHTIMTTAEFNAIELQQLLAPLRTTPKIKLVKYFSDTLDAMSGVNFSRIALQRGTVHVSNPQLFNDPFDCLPGIDIEQVEVGLLRSIAKYFGFEPQVENSPERLADELANSLNALPEGNLPNLVSLKNSDDLFMQNHYLNMLAGALPEGRFTGQGLLAFARQQVDGFLNGVRNCRISCFSTDPLNLYMWSHYANEHRGFCVEYETDCSALKAMGISPSTYESLFGCIYGVYYHLRRPDNTVMAVDWLTKRLDDDGIRRLYARILCSKGFNWVFESELRLIVQDQNIHDDLSFFPVRKIYIGQFMNEEARVSILNLCVERNVTAVEVDVSNSGYQLAERLLYKGRADE